jgi:P-type conjugative transfer ATPase TrbB
MLEEEPGKGSTPGKERQLEKLRRDCGGEFLIALDDAKTIEIVLNADGILWQERLGEGMRRIGEMKPSRAEAIIRTVASMLGVIVRWDRPLLEGEFPLDGSRFAAQLPPVVSAPTFALRKKASAVFTLDDYVESGIMTPHQHQVLKEGVINRKNILVIGGTGSGKTTLVNGLIDIVTTFCEHERILLIEDTGEIQCTAHNSVKFHTTLDVTMTRLLRTTLRMRPDRILVGEVRGPEALDLLMAWNTGHEGGIATLHANNARAGLDRLKTLITMNRERPEGIESLIAEAVHLIVHIAKTERNRVVKEVLAVEGFQNGDYITKPV